MAKTTKTAKTSKQLERYFKGAANHRRIDTLFLLNKKDSLSLDAIAKELDCNFKTISEHTKKLVNAGLLNKTYRGREVSHSLSPYGRKFIKFIITF